MLEINSYSPNFGKLTMPKYKKLPSAYTMKNLKSEFNEITDMTLGEKLKRAGEYLFNRIIEPNIYIKK